MSTLASKRKDVIETKRALTKITPSVTEKAAVVSSFATPDKTTCRRVTSTSPLLVSSGRRQEGCVFSTSKPTPLARALQAQWTLLQQNIQLGTISPTAEHDLLCLLESLPEHKSTILSDVEGVLPYLLAFAVAPIPSERTQAIALGAMQATVGSLVTVWGRKAAAVLVYDFLTVEHNALNALEVTLAVALGDVVDNNTNNSDTNVEDNGKCGGHKGQKNHEVKRVDAFTETRRAIISGALELILIMVTLSEPTATAALKHSKLIQNLVLCLWNSTPTQACDVANILLTLSAINGAAEVLVAYRVYHTTLWFVKSSVCAAVATAFSSFSNATVTAVCYFLRFFIRLAESPAVFELLQSDNTILQVMEEVLQSQWGEVLDIGCLWLTTILQCHNTKSAELASNLVFKSRVGEQLADMLLWPPNMIQHTLAAAFCWRWLALANPTAVGSFLVSNSNALFAFLQITLMKLAPIASPQHIGSATSDSDDRLCESSTKSFQLLTEVVCTLGICYGLGSRETRELMRRMILSRISQVTQAEVRRCVDSTFADLDKSCFDVYPAVPVPSRRTHVSNTSTSEEVIFTGSASETDVDIDDKVQTKRPIESEKRQLLLHSRDQWFTFILRSLTRLFRGTAHGTLPTSHIQHSHKQNLAAFNRRGSKFVSSSNDCSGRRLASTSLSNTAAAAADVAGATSSSCSSSLRPKNDVIIHAGQMGHSFYLDSIRVILRLAHHYKHSARKEAACSEATSRLAPMSLPTYQKKKDPNPWALPERVESSRRWSVADLQRSDALLFYISYDNIVTELTEALGAVEKHTEELNRHLQVCPTRAAGRRCVLNDLYMHVYPKIHMFLLFIQHHMTKSRPVLQIIADGERAIHSGNILDIYEAVGYCVGGSAKLPKDTFVQCK